MMNPDDFEPVELFVVVAKGKAGDVVLSQELDYTDAMAKLTILRQYRRSVRLEFTGYAPWINPEYLRAIPQAANLGGGHA